MTAKKTETAEETALAVTLVLDRDVLVKALSWVSKAISGHSSLPILQHVHIGVVGGTCTLSCCDLSQWHQERIDVQSSGDVELTVNAKRLLSLVQMLPVKSRVALNQEGGNKWRVSCQTVEMVFPSLPAEEFPMGDFTEGKTLSRFSLPAKPLAQALSSVLPFVSKDDVRPILTCVYFTAKEGKLVLAATNTNYLGKYGPGLPLVADGDAPEVNIPARGVQTLIALCETPEEEDAEIAFVLAGGGGQLQASVGDYTLTIRLLEGQFPNYERVIPTDTDKAFTVQAQELMGALARAGLIAADNSSRVVFDGGDPSRYHQLEVSASSSFGEHRELVEVAYSGDPIQIAFNVGFMQTMLKVASGVWKAEGVKLSLTEPLRPGIARCVGDNADKWLCVLMPMQVV